MIAWLVPLALAGLFTVAGPVVVHLLRRHRARRVQFPSLRFVQTTQTSAVRLRFPSDAWLLLVRAAIVALAAVALAQPIFMPSLRRAAWDRRVVRAIVVDTSESAAAAALAANEAAEAEAAAAAVSIRLRSPSPGRDLAPAAAALETLPAGRREIVVISDFQQGTITDADVASVPRTVGLRFVAIGTPRRTAAFDGETLLGAQSGSGLRSRITLDGPRTSVTLAAVPISITGIRIEPADERLLRIAASAGVPVPSADEPIALLTGGAGAPAGVGPIVPGWMLRTVLRMQQDPDLISAAAEPAGERRAVAAPWTAVAFDNAGNAIVSAAAAGTELVVRVAAPADSFIAAAALRAALAGGAKRNAWTEHEVETIAGSRLVGWTRPAGPVPPDAWRHAAPGDARWVWAVVLLMLGVEAALRRSRPAAPEVRADAA